MFCNIGENINFVNLFSLLNEMDRMAIVDIGAMVTYEKRGVYCMKIKGE